MSSESTTATPTSAAAWTRRSALSSSSGPSRSSLRTSHRHPRRSPTSAAAPAATASLACRGVGYQVFHRDLVPKHVEQLRTDAAAKRLCSPDDRRLRTPGRHRRRGCRRGAPPRPALTTRPRAATGCRPSARPHAWCGPAARSSPRRSHAGRPACTANWSSASTSCFQRLPTRSRPWSGSAGYRRSTPGCFSGYRHRPAQLRAGIRAGLEIVDLVSVEVIAFALTTSRTASTTRAAERSYGRGARARTRPDSWESAPICWRPPAGHGRPSGPVRPPPIPTTRDHRPRRRRARSAVPEPPVEQPRRGRELVPARAAGRRPPSAPLRTAATARQLPAAVVEPVLRPIAPGYDHSSRLRFTCTRRRPPDRPCARPGRA